MGMAEENIKIKCQFAFFLLGIISQRRGTSSTKKKKKKKRLKNAFL